MIVAITWALYILISVHNFCRYIHIFRIKISSEIANALYRDISVVKWMKLSPEIPWANSNLGLEGLTAGSILHSSASPTLAQVQLLLSKFSRCFKSMHCVREQDINKLFNAQGPLLLLISACRLSKPWFIPPQDKCILVYFWESSLQKFQYFCILPI